MTWALLRQALREPERVPVALREPRGIRTLLVLFTFVFLGFLLILPLGVVFSYALAGGWRIYLAALAEPDALAAIRLTLLVTVIVVPANTLFGLAAAWSLTKFRFRGQGLLVTLIDLPFSVSPVVAGLVFVLLFGRQGYLGGLSEELGLHVLYSTPGIVLATLFVTLPFVARELVPLMEMQGSEEEEAACLLGAGPWRLFFRITLPNVRWALLYGVILCNARAMGEFGAVSVVSGHIRGLTHTLPLQVEVLYNEYRFTAAFALASILSLLALLTLVLKAILERRVAE